MYYLLKTIGGGIVGCSTAYFLTRHPLFDPKLHCITILEATKVAGGSSGKAGGFIADWATPKCLAPLSFKTHNDLAKEHGGDRIWGHRFVYAAETKLQGQNLDGTVSHNDLEGDYPKALDWLAPGAVVGYDEIGTPNNSGQVHPFMFTTALAKLAQEKGAQLVLGSATSIDYVKDKDTVQSVTYMSKDNSTKRIKATDILVAAGPWTPSILPSVELLTPCGHSVVVKPSRDLSPYILFPEITAAPNSSLGELLSPDIYPRPPDDIFNHDTVYASGPDGYSVPLPPDTDSVEIDGKKAEQVWDTIKTVSQEIHDGEVLVRQACYKPQIRKHEEGEEVGPMVGPMPSVKGLWLATGHDEWGIQNGPGTGVVMSEMIFEGEAKSADCSSLDPKHYLQL